MGCPIAIGASGRRSSECLDSFHSAANRSGAPTKSLSPSIRRGSVGSSQVLNVCSGNSWRARSSKRVQASCAVRVTTSWPCGKLEGGAKLCVLEPIRNATRLDLMYLLIADTFIVRKSKWEWRVEMRAVARPLLMTRFSLEFWSSYGKAHLPSSEQAPDQDSRVSRADGNEVGSRGSEPSPEKRAQASDGTPAQQVRRRLSRSSDFPARAG